MSVRFNAVEIQNPQLDNELILAKSQRVLQPRGGGPVYVHNLSATLYRLELPFRGLRDDEKNALETFFETTAEGCYQCFLYMDHRGEPWLAHFVQDRLDFVCVDDAVSSTGTFSSDGDSYPTTAREEPVWDVDVELEGVCLPERIDYHLNDVGGEWASIVVSDPLYVVHAYSASAAVEGARGSLLTFLAGSPGNQYGRLQSASVLYTPFYLSWWTNFDGLVMGAADQFIYAYSYLRWQIELRYSGGVKQYRTAINPSAGLSYGSWTAIPSGWFKNEVLLVYPSRTGAGDAICLLFVNGSLAQELYGFTMYGSDAGSFRLGAYSGVDTTTLFYAKVDKAVVYGVA